MGRLVLLATAIAILDVAPVFAQTDGKMEVQRCVWSCLARSSGNQDPAYHACVEKVCSPKQRPASSRPRPTIQREAQTCNRTAGRAEAQKLVRQCLQISQATHPPCHADNPCSLIVDEIRRSCDMRRSAGIGVPTFCQRTAAARPTQSSGVDADLVRQVQMQLNALGYEPGAVDGRLGSETRRAIERFQRVKNLPSTGEPTPATTDALRQAYLSSQSGGSTERAGSTPLERDAAAGQATNNSGSRGEPLASSAGAANPGDRRQWLGAIYGNAAALVYGTPQSDDLIISFLCDRASKALTVAFISEPAGARDGMRVDMELSSEGGSVSLNATGQRLGTGAFQFEATARSASAIGRILTGGRILAVRLQQSTVAIPLAGAETHVAELVAACG